MRASGDCVRMLLGCNGFYLCWLDDSAKFCVSGLMGLPHVLHPMGPLNSPHRHDPLFEPSKEPLLVALCFEVWILTFSRTASRARGEGVGGRALRRRCVERLVWGGQPRRVTERGQGTCGGTVWGGSRGRDEDKESQRRVGKKAGRRRAVARLRRLRRREASWGTD